MPRNTLNCLPRVPDHVIGIPCSGEQGMGSLRLRFLPVRLGPVSAAGAEMGQIPCIFPVNQGSWR